MAPTSHDRTISYRLQASSTPRAERHRQHLLLMQLHGSPTFWERLVESRDGFRADELVGWIGERLQLRGWRPR
jgi:hypothetical protein